MSVYDYERVPLNTTLTRHHKHKLQMYCRIKNIPMNTLITLFVDELRVEQCDPPVSRTIEENAFKIQNLLGQDAQDRPIKEVYNDNNGHKKTVWIKTLFDRK